MKKFFLTFFLSIVWQFVLCQYDSSELVTVGNILIEGNYKTKPQMITRELSFKQGETYQRYQLDSMFIWDRNRIYNTNLFNEVSISIQDTVSENRDIKIIVDERWYFYPFPIFRLVDRNFNDWWVNRNRDLSRVNYGIKLTQFNFRGRGEILRLWLQTGFETVVNVFYNIPYIDKKQRNGLLISSSYFETKNVPVVTRENIRRFASSQNEVLRRAYRTSIRHSYRSSFYTFHRTTIGTHTVRRG